MSASVLFDAPGPRARVRHRILAGIGVVIVAGIVYVVLGKLNDTGQLEWAKWSPFFTDRAVWRDYLVNGLIGTFKAALISIVFAGVFGIVFGLGRLSEIAPIRWVSSVVVEFFRAVPVLIMMLASYGVYTRNGIFAADVAPLAGVVTGLTLYNGSVIAELVRSGVYGLPKGQREAGLSVGLTPPQTLRSILLPQALTAMLPALIGQFVVVLKDSALGYQITYLELLNWSKTAGSAFANPVQAYVVAGVLFILINYLLTVLAGRVQRRLNRRGRTTITGALPPGAGKEPVPNAQPAANPQGQYTAGGPVQNIDPGNTGGGGQ